MGDRRDSFCLRCRDLRERIEPAHDVTFFLFLLGFLDIDDRLEQGSLDGTGMSCCVSSGVGRDASGFSFAEEAALVGRDFGDDSPEAFSWPKNDHFFADLGVDGVDSVESLESWGSEPRRLGVWSGVLISSLSKKGSAVRGRASAIR